MSFFSNYPQSGQSGTDKWTAAAASVAGRPRFVVPRIVPLEPAVLAQTPDVLLSITHLETYSNGFGFTLILVAREGFKGAGIDPGLHIHCPTALRHDQRWTDFAPPPPEVLRLGVQYSDGTKATNLDELSATGGPTMLVDGGGSRGGGDQRSELDYWLQPLPPSGPLAIVYEWPRFDIPETWRDVDTPVVLAAAQNSIVLWPG